MTSEEPFQLVIDEQLELSHINCSRNVRNILDRRKLALFCSVKCPGNLILKTYELAKSLRDQGVTVISGFHSPIEQEVLNILLKGSQTIIICPARSIENMRIPAAWKPALEKNRLLVLSPFAKGHNRMNEANAVRRNKFVAEMADAVFVAYAAHGGKTESFCRDLVRDNKPLFTFDTPENQNLIALGVKPFTYEGCLSASGVNNLLNGLC